LGVLNVAFGRQESYIALVKAFRRVEDFFLKRINPADRYFFRARLLVQFELFSLSLAVGYFFVSFITDFVVLRYMMVVGVAIFSAQLFMLRIGISRHAIAQQFVFVCWSIIIFLTCCSGGISSPVVPWVTWIPMFALLMMGRRSGYGWGVVAALTIMVFYFTEGQTFVPETWVIKPGRVLTAFLYVGLTGMLLFVVSVFHTLGKQLLMTIRGQKEIIESQRNEIAARNENLEAEVEKRTRELQDYNKQLEQFAFIASHNLRAPVATLLGLGQLMDEMNLLTADREQIGRSMITTSRELDRVVRDLSTILEMRKETNEARSEVSMEEEWSRIRVSLDRELAEAQAELEADFRVPTVRTVRPLMDSIIMNLVSNAIKYKHPRRTPKIKLSTEHVNGEVCLSVSDNGIGIDLNAYGEKLFSLYGRFHNHVDGKGLGLYLVKNHVSTLGGRVEVDSEPDKGSTFRVYLKE